LGNGWLHANAWVGFCVCVCYVPETRAVLAQGIENRICDVCTARHTQRLQPMAPATDGNKTFICDLLLDSHTEIYLDEETTPSSVWENVNVWVLLNMSANWVWPALDNVLQYALMLRLPTIKRENIKERQIMCY